MGRIKVLFLEDVGRHGRAGEVREVANGYARNYLLPRKLAVPATKDQLQRVEKVRKAADERRLRWERDAQALAERLAATSLTFAMRTSSTGRLFGSVTNIHIAERLSEAVGVEIGRRSVILEEPIRELGTYAVEVRLPQHVSTTVTVAVEAEAATLPQAPTPAEAQPEEGSGPGDEVVPPPVAGEEGPEATAESWETRPGLEPMEGSAEQRPEVEEEPEKEDSPP